MKKLILIIFCLSIISTSFSQTENADANYLKVLKEYTLNDDGSMDFHYAKELKLLTHFSFHRLYGETFIVYNTDFQKLEINSAYTIMADGKKIITPDNAFNEVLPRFSTNAPAFNNIREMVVTHTGLEVNSVINLDYTITTEKGFYPTLMGDEILAESSPINELIIKVIIPESKTLNFELLNFSGQHIVNIEDGKKIHTWTFKTIPASSKDYYQEANHGDAPRLIFSTSKDLQRAYNNFVNQAAFDFETNTSMNETVSKITSDETNQLTIALQLQKLVSGDINNLNIPLEYTGFKCRTPIETWNSNQGTQLEKVLLLSALLHKANIVAEPITVIPNIYYDKEIGNLLSFNNFLVRIKLKNFGEVFISANHINKQNLKFELDGSKILLLDKNIESLKLISNKPTTSIIDVSGSLVFENSDTLVGKMFVNVQAKANPYFTYYNDSSKIKSIIKGGISSKNITSFEISKLTQETTKSQFEYKKDSPFEIISNYMSFELPYVSNGVDSWHINLLPVERSVSLEIPELIHEKYEYAVSFPEGFKPISKNVVVEIENTVGYLLIKFERSKNEIIITREIRFTKKIIEVNNYSDFREIMNSWNSKNYKKILLKK